MINTKGGADDRETESGFGSRQIYALIGNRRERKPTHPGELIREDLLAEAGLSRMSLR